MLREARTTESVSADVYEEEFVDIDGLLADSAFQVVVFRFLFLHHRVVNKTIFHFILEKRSVNAKNRFGSLTCSGPELSSDIIAPGSEFDSNNFKVFC